MVDRTLKPDSGNDLVLQNNGGGTKIEIPNSGDISISGTIGSGTLGSSVVIPSSIGGAMNLISKATASNSASIEFTGINSLTQFRHIVFYVHNLIPATETGASVRLRIAKSGTTYDSDSGHYRNTGQRNFWNGSTASGDFTSYRDTQAFFGIPGAVGNQSVDDNLNEADGGFNAIMTIFNAPHTVKYHHGIFNSSWGSNDGYILSFNGAGQYVVNDSPITAFQFTFNSGNITSGSIAMYGVKDA